MAGENCEWQIVILGYELEIFTAVY